MSYIQSLVEAATNRGYYYSGDKAAKLPELPCIQYACPVCEKVYENSILAHDCANQPVETYGLKVGDLLLIPGKHVHNGNFDAKRPDWIWFQVAADLDSRDHFDRYPHVYLWWVVTALHMDLHDRHKVVYTVVSLANNQLWGGYNTFGGHEHAFVPGLPMEKQPYAHRDHDGKINDYYWTKVRNGKTIGERILAATPSDTLRAEAAELAAIGISTTNLL